MYSKSLLQFNQMNHISCIIHVSCIIDEPWCESVFQERCPVHLNESCPLIGQYWPWPFLLPEYIHWQNMQICGVHKCTYICTHKYNVMRKENQKQFDCQLYFCKMCNIYIKKLIYDEVKKCEQCVFASSNKTYLRSHLKTHSGEKSNKCSQCDYASSQAGTLRRHLKTHSREKSNKCNQCYYACSNQSDLRRHLKTHSGEKPNKCNQCDFASFYASALRTHLKMHYFENVLWEFFSGPLQKIKDWHFSDKITQRWERDRVQ